jgi:hypothetical protein
VAETQAAVKGVQHPQRRCREAARVVKGRAAHVSATPRSRSCTSLILSKSTLYVCVCVFLKHLLGSLLALVDPVTHAQTTGLRRGEASILVAAQTLLRKPSVLMSNLFFSFPLSFQRRRSADGGGTGFGCVEAAVA